uniref:ADAM metallopeptidase domain 12 n=1 Tax=Pavo cristatus TaxID=9049 RepID=A0A8C9L650_PAVCR
MSKRLRAERQRSPAPRPSVLLLSLSALLLASPRARGQNVDSKLESLRQQMLKEQSKDYEITVPFLLNGEQWRPANSIYSKNHPSLLQLVIQAEGQRLVIHLERNEVLKYYLFSCNQGHCYYHGNVRGYPSSSVSLSTCSGLRGIIVFENKSYVLEPLEGATSEHKIYRAENLEIVPGSCGHQLDVSATRAADTSHRSQAGRYKRETLKTTKYVELVIVADNREFQRQGKDVEKIKQRLIEIANYVDKLKPAGISCRESSNSCDLPEFCTGASPHCPANVYLHDGHACHGVDGYCYNGICQTHEQQCITLWGQGAKPAPGICFERVNSAGDPYGNCGKDSKSSFAKCEPRDAKCGKIQCQGGANRPVIGTNAVSIETNIPLQEGGKILCRGTHVYLGDDMPDPGLVLSGTKCEDGKICLNRRCQNTSVFGVHKCATKCHGRGVCNNKKNCHCEADWAPPYCDKPGFGGSVDSGPIRQADNKSLTVGVLITILCLTFAGSVMYLKRKTLMRFLFTSKKTTIEKLRSVSPARSSRSSKPNHVRTASLSKNLIMKPQNTNVQKRDGPRRPLPYQIVDISDPVKTHHVPQLKTPQRVLPPLPQPPCHQAGPERPLPANPMLRVSQENHKPNPPRKPLPADPLNKARYNSTCTPGLGHTKALPHIAPVRLVLLLNMAWLVAQHG